jgi:hypothetical protein
MNTPERTTIPDNKPLPRLARIPSLVTFLAGVWLVAAPFVLDYRGAATWVDGSWNDILVGAAIIVVSATRVLTPPYTAPLSLATAALGGWLIVAPFALSYDTSDSAAAMTNDITTGIVVVVFALVSWLAGERANLRRSRTARDRRAG